MRTLIKYAALIAVVFLLCILAIVTIHRKIDVKFKNGGTAKIRAASILASVFGSKCTIEIKSISGKHAEIALLQAWFDGPFMVIATTNENIFLCIYDHDVDFQLLRIDLSQKFQPLKANDFCKGIVIASDCKIARVLKADTDDWAIAVATIQQMPAGQYRRAVSGLELGFCSLHTTQKTLLDSLRNFGDQGQYPGDVYIPWYMQNQNTNRMLRPTPER